MLFCVAAADDPVVPIVQRLIREHPEIPARLLVGRGGGGPNPKLDNLMKAWDVAAYDWIVLADSNVLIPPDYLDRLFARWSERCAVVCSPPVGIDVHGWAAELEAAFLNTFEARWQLAGDEIGFGFAQGKTMLLRRSDLAREGGLAALAREVAEDAAATKFARRLGREVRVVDQPFPQPLGRRTLPACGGASCAGRGCAGCRSRPSSAPSSRSAACSRSSRDLARDRGRPAVGGSGGHDARLVRRRGAAGARLRLAAAARSPLFWIARDLLLPVLWVRAWTLKGYEWRGSAVDVRPTAPAPDDPSAMGGGRRGPQFGSRALAASPAGLDVGAQHRVHAGLIAGTLGAEPASTSSSMRRPVCRLRT